MTGSLLQRVHRGDASAVKECIEAYGGLVWSLARRMCSREHIEDAVQEIFIAVWENAGRYDPQKSAETTYIAMIARRKLIDGMRRAGRRPESEPLSEDSASNDARPSSRLELGDEVRQVTQAMAQLSPDQQRVLQLSVRNGWTYEQISERSGLPLGTVKTHARRGLIRIRDMLKKTGDESAG